MSGTLRVIGTAGHVDHGKSTLVRRLTGIDPDRLAEEKAREMTIDLGFAWLDLPIGGGTQTVGIVDVPGHRDFIENMLAGVGGIDAVLLVIAADEGIMPQTREHLAILDLLGIQHGIVALTKSDLIDDPEWIDLMRAEIAAALASTALHSAPIVPVSAQSGSGIPNLTERLARLLESLPARAESGLPRLPIDRVFSISGFGMVVTGTLAGGALRIGDEVEIQPAGERGRVRGLQSYQRSVEIAYPGTRTAVNLTGISRSAVRRGHVLAPLNLITPTVRLDAYLRYLPDSPRPLAHNAAAKIFTGAAESTARIRLLSHEILHPGETGWIQLDLDTPLAVTRGDRFILRFPSPAETVGGGVIVDPHPRRRWKRLQLDVIAGLELRLIGTPAEQLAQALITEPLKRGALKQKLNLNDVQLETALTDALNSDLVRAVSDGTYIATSAWRTLIMRIESELSAFHAAAPLRLGMSREALRSRLGLKHTLLTTLLGSDQRFAFEGDSVRLANHHIHFMPEQIAAVEVLRQQFNAAPYTPPSFADAAQIVGEDVLYALIDLGELVQVQADVLLMRPAYEAMIAGVFALIDQTGAVTAAALRDHFGTSRKYAIGLLEHTDALGLTRREGDSRVRGRAAPSS